MTPTEKAEQFIQQVEHLVDGWRNFAVARWMAMASLEAVSGNPELEQYYFEVIYEIDRMSNLI